MPAEAHLDSLKVILGEQARRLRVSCSRAVSWLLRRLYRLLYVVSYPVVRVLFSFLAIVVLANMMYVILKVMFSPVGLVQDEVHFDFLHEDGPTANLTLVSSGQQWQLGPGIGSPHLCDDRQAFLDKNTEYDISLAFTLARSRRNWDLGKVMVYLSLADCRGDRVAASARSMHLPFQSDVVHWADTLLRLPLYLTNLLHDSETVNINMMRGFLDASGSLSPTYSLQVLLSKNAVNMDIERSNISIDPRPKGLAYLFYVFPFSSFFVINSFFVIIFVASSSCIFALGYSMQRSTAVIDPIKIEDDDDLEQDDGSFSDNGSSEHGSSIIEDDGDGNTQHLGTTYDEQEYRKRKGLTFRRSVLSDD